MSDRDLGLLLSQVFLGMNRALHMYAAFMIPRNMSSFGGFSFKFLPRLLIYFNWNHSLRQLDIASRLLLFLWCPAGRVFCLSELMSVSSKIAQHLGSIVFQAAASWDKMLIVLQGSWFYWNYKNESSLFADTFSYLYLAT